MSKTKSDMQQSSRDKAGKQNKPKGDQKQPFTPKAEEVGKVLNEAFAKDSLKERDHYLQQMRECGLTNPLLDLIARDVELEQCYAWEEDAEKRVTGVEDLHKRTKALIATVKYLQVADDSCWIQKCTQLGLAMDTSREMSMLLAQEIVSFKGKGGLHG